MNHLVSVAMKSKKREMSFFFPFAENKEDIENSEQALTFLLLLFC